MHWLIISIEFNEQALQKTMERERAERDGRSGSGNGAGAESASYRNEFERGAAFHRSRFAHIRSHALVGSNVALNLPAGTQLWKNRGGRALLWKNQRWWSCAPVRSALL